MQELFEAIRDACSGNTWSRGVELARDGCVTGNSDTPADDELALRVRIPGSAIAASVALFPGDEDWDCDCNTKADACEHTAAAVIAVRRARQRGEPLGGDKAAGPPGRVRYRLERNGGGLHFEREIVGNDTDSAPFLLTTTLDAIAKGRVDGPTFAATQADMAVEVALGAKRRGKLDEATLRRIAEPLARCDDVALDGAAVRVSDEPVRPVVVVEDVPAGFLVRLSERADIDEHFAGGFVLVGGELRPVGASRLNGRELHDLRPGTTFALDAAAHVVTELLPSLEDRLDIELRTERLPRSTRREPPRIRVATERRGDRLSVLATLVYGDPPLARVDAGKLVHLSGEVPVRDLPAERSETARIQRQLGLKPGRRVDLSGREAIEFAEQLGSWRGDVDGDAFRAFHLAEPLHPSFDLSGRALDVGFAPDSADENESAVDSTGHASADAVLGAWRDGESVVPLQGGGFAPLPTDWLERYGALVADLLAARNEAGEVATCALPDLARLCDALDEPAPPELEALRPLIEGFEGIPQAQLPSDLKADLRPYQRSGVDWLDFLRQAELGALLADDMGLGKTLQTLCAIRGRGLVIAPTSVLGNWRDEAAKFRPELRTHIYHGPGRKLDPQADLTLTSYALLRIDAELLKRENWDYIVLDEAQMIKNPESQVAQAAFRLRAPQRIALTGTPVENRLEELWSQLHFLNPGLLGGRSDFRNRYARPIANGDRDTAQHLRDRIRPFLLRRLKRDVARELPPRSDVVLRFELSSAERSVYDAIRAAGLKEAVDALRTGGSLMPALEVLLRLRQAACHSELIPRGRADGAEIAEPDDPADSSKLELLIARLEQARDDDHRALVFSQWTKLLDRIGPALDAAKIPYVRLDGSTRDRSGVVARFQSGEVPVMLASLRAGGTGLNLTAADHVFLMDPWWNPAVEDQAADRAHRIGQTRPVVVHRLIAQDTVEERILALHATKRALAEAALGEGSDDVGGSGMSREDLLALLD